MHLLGYDVGSSSIKATLLNAESGQVAASASSPRKELAITAVKPGWAEQDPQVWWEHVKRATLELKAKAAKELADVRAVGISYQMHGLVLIDRDYEVLRPAIIWCDSRAVAIGDRAAAEIGPEVCLERLLNSPGNFTASKLKWVKDHEPEIFGRVYKMMLPGDYIAMKLTGEVATTPSGLSEGILWDYQQEGPAELVLDYYGIPAEMLAEVRPTFSVQGTLTKWAGEELGLPAGIAVSYRAGDQPNNSLSLNVREPGEVAATAGTSGVVYGVGDQPNYDRQSRVNSFVHVNHRPEAHRYGVLLCISGTGILNSWLKHNLMGTGEDYPQMNEQAGRVPVGSEGLVILPYGNGAERSLRNREIGASMHHLNFNIHRREHFLRAAQEGIVFALRYGVQIMREMGIEVSTVRAGRANMFLSRLFATAFATLTKARVELYNTDGAQGAARGAGIGAGIYATADQAFASLRTVEVIEPDGRQAGAYEEAYEAWLAVLQGELEKS